MYIFDPNTNTWCRGSDMDSLHSNGNLMLLGSQVVHTGGHWVDGLYWDDFEIYDTKTDTWSPHGYLPHLWLYHQCAAVYIDF